MKSEDIEKAIMGAAMPSIVKKVDWEVTYDSDGEKIIRVEFHIPKSDNATPKQIAEIISAQRTIEKNLSSEAIDSLPYFNVLADVPASRRTPSIKKKTTSNA